MKYREHIPGYMDTGFDPKEVEFKTLEELLKTDTVVARFASGEDLKTLALSEVGSLFGKKLDYCHLMADMVDGRHWVTGYVFGTDEELASLNLPKWVHPKKRG